MENRKRLGILALSALGGSTLFLTSTQQVAAEEPISVSISYRDLDLSRPADVRILSRRLQHAAERVCVAPPHNELVLYTAFKHCVQTTLADAVARIRSPELERAVADLNRGGGELAWTARARR